MPIKVEGQKGFTLVEVSIALALSGLGLLALVATSDYFQKSKLVIDTRTAHLDLRNEIFQALSQKITNCPAGSLVNCVKTSACANNLRLKGGLSFALPPAIAATLSASNPAPVTEADRVELDIAQSSAGAGAAPASFISSSNIPGAPTRRESADRLQYEVLLTGVPRSIDLKHVNYTGSVILIGHRNLIGREDSLRAEIPIEFTMNRSTQALEECETRLTERSIAGGQHNLDDCTLAGGVPVPSALGPLCRFRSKLIFQYSTSYCPPGFIGDPATGCTVDTTATSALMSTIPPCPAVKTKDGLQSVAGVVDVSMNLGNEYCNYQGPVPATLGTTEVGDCPPDPLWDGTTLPRLGWNDVTSPFDIATNLRKCKYTFDCPAPNQTVVFAAPVGDGFTPTCKYVIANCPNIDEFGNPITPAPWLQTSSAPLTCVANTTAVPTVTLQMATCKAPFMPVPSAILSSHPEIAAWNDSNYTIAHIICM